MGTPGAPGAYDAVVYGVPLGHAAALIRGSDTGFSRVLPEGAHGPEGAHLHIEIGGGLTARTSGRAVGQAGLAEPRTSACASIYERIVGGRRSPRLSGC
jgi:hypothetical protein